MDFDIDAIDFIPGRDYKKYTRDNDGEVARDLYRRGLRLATLARLSVGKDTGRLAQSISVHFIPGPGPTVLVGSDLDYAYIVHEGTDPHTIEAGPGEMLRFKIRGRIVYVQQVQHPGTDAQKYLSRHLRKVLND